MIHRIHSIIERLYYINSCLTEKDVLVFESVKLSEKQIEETFDEGNQQLLKQIFDTTVSLSKYPVDKDISIRINFLTQLFFELDYFSSPSSVRSFRYNELVEWDPSLPHEEASVLKLPHLYKHFGKVYYMHLQINSANFNLNPITTLSACCNSLIYILNTFNNTESPLTSSEEICLQDVLQAIMTLVIKPIIEMLTVTCHKIITKSFEECFDPIIVS